MKNVLLIKGISQYDAMRYYIDEIELGFRLAGYNTIILDTMDEAMSIQVNELRKSVNIDYVFTCNAVAQEIIEKFPNAVYLTYLCDHPAFHRERLEFIREDDIVFICDELYCEYIKEYCANIKYVKYIPLSGSYSRKYIPYSERENKIIFTGSYAKPEDIYQSILLNFDGSLRSIVKYMLKDIINYPHQTLDMCLKKALQQFKITDIEKSEYHELVGDFMLIDTYARSYYRDQVIRMLVENNVPIHVFGNGWENFQSKHKENLFIEKGNSYVARKAVASSKISLNIMPWFKAGFQERIATAMLSGTIAVTDNSEYIRNHFENEKELVTYSLEHLDGLPDKIKYLLEQEEYAAQIAEAGKERAEQELTWQHRTFEMLNYIRQCTGDYDINDKYGQVLQIPYSKLNVREIGKDAINGIDEILEILKQLQKYDRVDLCDIKYLYQRFIYLFIKTKANFPEIVISDFVYKYLNNLEEKDLDIGLDLLMMECTNIQSLFLKAEYEIVNAQLLKNQRDNSSVSAGFSSHEQEVLIKKLMQNYSQNNDPDIIEILHNINVNKSVGPYNQKFIARYGRITQTKINEVQYDEEAQMHYVIWNGKKMYYPKSHSKLYVASEVNFVNLEQDVESPHRYLTEEFQVDEGDVVIDAGVAEGNFALDIVEKVQKLYLVECEHEWVEALERTFEPWKEKVVIIEKMLDEYDDDTHISIDSFVEEEQVNFIKMDIEGAEIPALNGAMRLLRSSKKIKCVICSYHRKNAEKDIREKLEKIGFSTSTTNGYIFFREDIDSWVDGELRRGVVRGEKYS